MLTTEIKVEISCGELIDKLTILSIKKEKIQDIEKLKNVEHEFQVLSKLSTNLIDINPEQFDIFYNELREINFILWEIEDNIRKFEKKENFGESFVQLARSVYKTNDKRFEIKNNINSFYSSGIKEEKNYEKY